MDVSAVFSSYMSTKVNKVDRTKKADDNNGDVAIIFGGQDTVSISSEAQTLYEKMRLLKLEEEKAGQEQAQRAASQAIRKIMYTEEELAELDKQEVQTFAQVLKEVEDAEEEVAAGGASGLSGASGAAGASDSNQQAEALKGRIKALRSQIQQVASSDTVEAVKEGKIAVLESQVEALESELAELEAGTEAA